MNKMEKLIRNSSFDWSEYTFRTAITMCITSVAESKPEVMLMVADLGRAMMGEIFSKRFPQRYIQAGIAEQNLIGMAAGLASCGKIPFAATFAPFATMRCCEQIRDDAAYTGFNVKIVGHDCGIVLGTLGVTHYGIEDMGVMRSIPQMTIISPADGPELYEAVWQAAEIDGPVYLRVSGGISMPDVYEGSTAYRADMHKATVLREGGDITLVATGTAVHTCLEAAKLLEAEGISACVINVRMVKPIDAETVSAAVLKTRHVVTVEEHSVCGGLGTAVAEVLAEAGHGRLVRIGLPDAFSYRIGSYDDLLKRYGLTARQIVNTAKEALDS